MNKQSYFIPVGKGRLTLFHRPGGKAYQQLVAQGCTHVVTLMRASEGAEGIGQSVEARGMRWLWVQVPNGDYPRGEVHEQLLAGIECVSGWLDEGASVLIHCSAGIHRTGMFAYGLLRWRGLSPEAALEQIGRMREQTRAGILARHIRWGNENAREAPKQETKWTDSINVFAKHWLTKIFRPR